MMTLAEVLLLLLLPCVSAGACDARVFIVGVGWVGVRSKNACVVVGERLWWPSEHSVV